MVFHNTVVFHRPAGLRFCWGQGCARELYLVPGVHGGWMVTRFTFFAGAAGAVLRVIGVPGE